MPFLCPSCKRPHLEITCGIELPPDSRSDEITLQALHCSACSFAATAVYEESRRGSLDSECVNHEGYGFPPARVEEIEELIGRCPEPSRGSCQCASHRLLGRTKGGRWSGLDDLAPVESFPMTLACEDKDKL